MVTKQFWYAKSLKWSIIGGGNGGQAMAGHLAIMGFSVKIYDIFLDTIEEIKKQGGIKVEGVVQGFGKLELATTNITEALNGADIIAIVTPALAHKEIAKNCAPYLKDDQIVFLHPGSTFGAFEFKKVLLEEGCEANPVIADAETLLYACRCKEKGHVNILGIKNRLKVAALPSNETERVVKMLNTALPQIYPASNVMEISLENVKPMVHPAPTLLNTSMIESKHDWLYYWDGITPSIGHFVEEMDKERLNVAKALGLKVESIFEVYKRQYDVEALTLTDVVRKTKAYAGVKGQKNLNTRYITEDIPMGLVPLVSLGRMLGVNVERMATIIELGEYLLDKDFTTTGRTVENVGLSGMTSEEIINYVQTGKRENIALSEV
ncbi:NAD/NADP octopine/nopaline dehydrogenase family protein [Anaeromicrobium sediminis]|nr:NAD/NADP-dependent octopine/nopaline dehydrogenase family protein [Anaeromicrobium sediminis]